MSKSIETGTVTDFEASWSNLYKEAIIPLINFLEDSNKINNNKLFQNDTYIKIYTICYNICTQRHPYNFSSKLYNKYKEFLSDYLTYNISFKLKTTYDESLLIHFIKYYDNQKIMVKWLINFMIYLDRFYVKQNELDTLECISDKLFESIIFKKFSNNITSILIKSINNYRITGNIDTELITRVINIYEYMDTNLSIYKCYFMDDFLLASREYYFILSSKWISEYTVQSYLINFEDLIEREKELVYKYLNPITDKYLIDIIYDEFLIKPYNKILLNETYGIEFMLDNKMYNDLYRIYKLYNKYSEQLDIIVDLFKNNIYKSSNFNSNIEELILINNKYDLFIYKSFEDNKLFKIAKKDVFISFVNKDNNIELIISFIDKLLKSDISEKYESYIDSIIILYSYIIDKDIFINLYRKSLSKRLLNQKSTNNDLEKYIISKIKIESGLQITSKIEGMMNDLVLSNQQNNYFNDYLKDKSIFIYNTEFNIHVLTNSHWPNFRLFDVIIPIEMQKMIILFNEYFLKINTHKKISWIYTQGTLLLKGVFNKKSYDINVSTLQAIVLLLFNDTLVSTLNFENIAKLTNIPHEILKRVLHSLSCGKFYILKKIEKDNEVSDNKIIKNTDIFEFNNKFTSPIRKIKIPMPSIDDIKENSSKIEEDRSYIIEASIVRIMKSRKTMDHNSLVSEVLSQLIHFKPEPKAIKRIIESLIERDFLERNEEHSNMYNYLA
jgi:cullin 1